MPPRSLVPKAGSWNRRLRWRGKCRRARATYMILRAVLGRCLDSLRARRACEHIRPLSLLMDPTSRRGRLRRRRTLFAPSEKTPQPRHGCSYVGSVARLSVSEGQIDMWNRRVTPPLRRYR
eukprot:scaffold192962_cov28-Tisochrysis_lutea.AAC.2